MIELKKKDKTEIIEFLDKQALKLKNLQDHPFDQAVKETRESGSILPFINWFDQAQSVVDAVYQYADKHPEVWAIEKQHPVKYNDKKIIPVLDSLGYTFNVIDRYDPNGQEETWSEKEALAQEVMGFVRLLCSDASSNGYHFFAKLYKEYDIIEQINQTPCAAELNALSRSAGQEIINATLLSRIDACENNIMPVIDWYEDITFLRRKADQVITKYVPQHPVLKEAKHLLGLDFNTDVAQIHLQQFKDHASSLFHYIPNPAEQQLIQGMIHSVKGKKDPAYNSLLNQYKKTHVSSPDKRVSFQENQRNIDTGRQHE